MANLINKVLLENQRLSLKEWKSSNRKGSPLKKANP